MRTKILSCIIIFHLSACNSSESQKASDGTELMSDSSDYENKSYLIDAKDSDSGRIMAPALAEHLCEDAFSVKAEAADLTAWDNTTLHNGQGIFDVHIIIRFHTGPRPPAGGVMGGAIQFEGRCVVNTETRRVLSKQQEQ